MTVGDKNIYDATDESITDFRDFIDGLKLTKMQEAIGSLILKGNQSQSHLPYRCRT